VDIQGRTFIKGNTGMAFIAGFTVCRRVFAIDGFGQDARSGCFAYATGAAK